MNRVSTRRWQDQTTYLLRLDGNPSDELARFIERVQTIELLEIPRPIRGRRSDPPEELMP